MVAHNIRVFAFVILGLAFGTYVAIFLLTQDLSSIDFSKATSHISTTISINIIFWLVFIKWLWKFRLFYPWLVQVPNLSGKWKGTIKSNWDNGTQDPIPMEITIDQTFLNIQVRIKTEESRSFSLDASFNIDKDRGQQQLFYSYLNTPKPGVRDRSQIHYGSALLMFDGYDKNEMEGEYWTSRETTGEMHLKRVENANT
ncbi:hypothetical protein [Nitrosococcus wardiae]|uniref:Uncharacterized protein n=1 Tax=Nitrosococcus wardiae TaxID=1814290 RepID=A0A4P7C4W2_9GAMM|nr:hypothetical protein [Nitrosococcus wardiae]QBQ56006.1 hypothetical protein E3U44_16930 [Nitrosococcus wardiae]